jgi:phage gp29-like protein
MRIKLSEVVSKFSGRRSPPMGEVAAVRTALSLMPPYNPDDLIGKRGYAVYDQMQRDAQVQACLQIKKLSLLSRGWQVHPANDSPEAVRVADFVRFALEDMRGSILDVLYNALDAMAKGFSVMEINWRIVVSLDRGSFDRRERSDDRTSYAGMIGLESIKSKDPSTFMFDLDDYANIRSLRRVRSFGRQGPSTIKRSNDQTALPVDKFVIYSYCPRYESPYGTSDLRAAWKHYWSKDLLIRFMNLYLEKYGSPTAKGSYKRGTPRAAQDELLKVLDKIQQETAIVIPDDVQVELLEANRGGEAGYLAAIEFHDKQIAKAILNQTLMTDEGMRVGSFALAKVHLDVLKMCLAKIKRDLEETVMREQVIRRLVDYNFNTASYPTFSLGPLEDADMESLAGVIAKLVSGEVIKPDEPWIREYLGIPS